MKRRILGLETEYGLATAIDGRWSPDANFAVRHLLRPLTVRSRHLPPSAPSLFLPENGARVYVDTGAHPEFATPECTSVRDVVRYDKAGEALFDDLRRECEAFLAREGRQVRILLLKNNVDSTGNTYGCHENYLIDRSVTRAHIEALLVPHLVTRQVFTGAGHVEAAENGDTLFRVGQRAPFIQSLFAAASTRDRPIVHERDEPHADAARYRRLHLLLGDTNMCEVATFLKIGTTSLVLRLIEDAPHEHLDTALLLDSPVAAVQTVGNDTSCRRAVGLRSGRRASGLEVQWQLWERCTTHIARYGAASPEDTTVLGMWHDVLHALESDTDRLVGHVDWVTKRRLLGDAEGRGGGSAAAQRWLSFSYHDVSGDGLFGRLSRRGLVARVVGDDEVADAGAEPPATRARIRAHALRFAAANGLSVHVDWSRMRLSSFGGDGDEWVLHHPDPFRTECEELARLQASPGVLVEQADRAVA